MRFGLNIYLLALMALSFSMLYSLPVSSQDASDDKSVEEGAKPGIIDASAEESDDEISIISSLPWRDSIMFNRDKLDELYSAIEKYNPEKSSAALEFTPNTTTTGEPTVPILESAKTPPSYHLQSVLYLPPESWSIWINGKRIRKGQTYSPELEILNVTKDSVEFLLKSESLDEVSPDWQTRMVNIAGREIPGIDRSVYNWNYQSKDGKVLADERSGVLRFSLSLNQNLSLKNMEVAEGRGSVPYGSGFAGDYDFEGSATQGATEGAEFESLVDEIFQSVSP